MPDLGDLIRGPETLDLVNGNSLTLSAEDAERFRRLARDAGEYLGRGTDRLVFAAESGPLDNAVVKVPRHENGEEANEKEHKRYHGSGYNFPMAPCEIADSGVLYMVRVDPVPPKKYTNLPGWAKRVDGGQVGWLDGELVAFDYGSYVPGMAV